MVDDEPTINSAIARTLSPEHDVATVTRAGDALARLRSGERYDVIFCDLMMPQMTGMDLHRELAAELPDQAARMIFLTGGAFTAGRPPLPRRRSPTSASRSPSTPACCARSSTNASSEPEPASGRREDAGGGVPVSSRRMP